MAYLNRNTSSRKTAPSAEFLYLLIALAAGAATFWYAGHKIGMDLSAITTAATILGIGQKPINYDPRAPVQSANAQVVTTVSAEESTAPPAPYCNPGQAPAFANGMAQLQLQLGETMGTPLECEHAASAAGDTVQQTTTGLASYNAHTNTVSFTDGWRHWALGAEGVVAWEGSESSPPNG
jgi:hypothetical protein